MQIALVVHGDDLDADAAAEVYGPAVETERLHLVPRSGAISTTDVIARVLSRSGHPTHETRA